MKAGEKITVGNDGFRLIKASDEDSALGCVFDITICARCDQYRYCFHHEEGITYLACTGALLFEVNEELIRVDNGQFIDIPVATRYRFRSLERQPVMAYAFSTSDAVSASWLEAGSSIRQHAVIGRDGITRFA